MLGEVACRVGRFPKERGMSADDKIPDFEIIPGEAVVLDGVEYTWNAANPLTFVPPSKPVVSLADIDALPEAIHQAIKTAHSYCEYSLPYARRVIIEFLDKYGIAHEAVE
jgi:hypothetical protein